MTSDIGNYGLVLQTAPAVEPVSLVEAKKQVEVATANTAHDAQLNRLIIAAREAAEAETHRQIITATWDLYRDKFPTGSDRLWLPFGQLQTVTYAKYKAASDGTLTTWDSASYVVSASREPACLRPAYSESWPTPRAEPDAVVVRFVCGYGDADDVPELLKAGMLLLIGHWFEHREGVVTVTIATELPRGVQDIFQKFFLGDSYHSYAT